MQTRVSDQLPVPNLESLEIDLKEFPFQTLPFDIVLAIAAASYRGWRLMLCIPQFGRFTLTPEGVRFAEKHFCGQDSDGRWMLGNLLHHSVLPAIVRDSGVKEWYWKGKRHREDDLPAIEYPSGTREWFHHGLPHRSKDKPSSIFYDGTMYWKKYGNNHRGKDQPAIVRADGTKEWWVKGKKVEFKSLH